MTVVRAVTKLAKRIAAHATSTVPSSSLESLLLMGKVLLHEQWSPCHHCRHHCPLYSYQHVRSPLE